MLPKDRSDRDQHDLIGHQHEDDAERPVDQGINVVTCDAQHLHERSGQKDRAKAGDGKYDEDHGQMARRVGFEDTHQMVHGDRIMHALMAWHNAGRTMYA